MSATPAINQTLSSIELGPPEVHQLLFSWIDYTIFTAMLGLSVTIGMYVIYFGKKQDNITEYILAGKTMNIWPIALSLIASEITDITIGSAEIFANGATVWLSSFSMAFGGIISSWIFLPVFFKLQLTCIYEYLTDRFDQRIRMLSSFFFVFSMVIHMPIVIFVPSLAFNQATGINVHIIAPLVASICIFYTTFGGLKAVVWTDTFQFMIILAAIFTVLIAGFAATGSPANVFQKSYDGGRLDIWNMDPDPTIRTSFWSVVIGSAFSSASYLSCSQNCIQKFLAVPTFSKAKKSIAIFVVGMFIFDSLSALTGLIIYAKYWDCDPVTTRQVKQADQIVPYFIMDVAGKIPGLPGLFISGVFCGALSTLSADMNTVSGAIYEDFIKPFMPGNTTEKRASDVMKCIVVVVGVLATCMVFIVEQLGSIFTLGGSLNGISHGPLIGIFSLGMLVPFANSKGTLTGGLGGMSFMAWIVFGAQYYTSQGANNTPALPASVDGCDYPYFNNLTSHVTPTMEPIVAPWIHRISFFYYTLIGGTVTITIGVIASLLTGGRNQKVNRDLLSPVIYFLLPEEVEKHTDNSVEHGIELTENKSVNVEETK